ncbi:hypothetical protein LWP59_25905 [Amycolatopsis acidiphila]|uniref:hypothetical protein n=1 Tax=Amycolatopsis acidiphila TaxID=715473 RepID=UPI001643CEE6|nr:hypothetical protein [Amycolatopsis acidiphila]UIJ57570.1 hypothetical protein LWP59_25905 [Amycolatopsis acidiphila]GHG89554.1 hypothetical protein GCM10017788_64390 [Amycolatopsis acidiphila]
MSVNQPSAFTSDTVGDDHDKFGEVRIRCPMVHVKPRMLARPDELEAGVVDRSARAEAEGWAGEIEGIDMTPAFLRAEREDAQRRLRQPGVDLGIPSVLQIHKKQRKNVDRGPLHSCPRLPYMEFRCLAS